MYSFAHLLLKINMSGTAEAGAAATGSGGSVTAPLSKPASASVSQDPSGPPDHGQQVNHFRLLFVIL